MDPQEGVFSHDEPQAQAPVIESVGSSLEALSAPEMRAQLPDDGVTHDAALTLSPQEQLERAREYFDPLQTSTALISSLNRIGRELVGFEPVAIQTAFALMTGGHQFIESDTGMAKTLYVRSVLGALTGADVFETQLAARDTEEVLFGGLDFDQYKKGRRVINTQGSLVESDIAYLDEFSDGNIATLRSLLRVLNEGEYTKGQQIVPSRLHSAICTANYMPGGGMANLSDADQRRLEAVINRLEFRARLVDQNDTLSEMRKDSSFARTKGEPIITPEAERVPFVMLRLLSEHIKGPEIEIPGHVYFLKNQFLKEWQKEAGVNRISPRESVHTAWVLKAAALLRGREEVVADDLDILQYNILTVGDPAGQERFSAKLDAVVNTYNEVDRNALDTLSQIQEMVETVTSDALSGRAYEPNRWEKLLMKLRVTDLGKLTFATLGRQAGRVATNNQVVKDYREQVKEHIKISARRLNRREEDPLFG